MPKTNNKGFFLIETIVVVLIILVVLIAMYRQLVTIYNNYQNTASYNSIASIHAASNVKRYLEQNSMETLVANLGNNQYLDITNYDLGYSAYYTNLKTYSNIKKIYFTRFNINVMVNNLNSYGFDATFEKYLKTLKLASNSPYPGRYRIIVILNDNTYGNIDFTI